MGTEAVGRMGCTVGRPGATGAAKGMTFTLDWALGGRPGRRLRPLEIAETDLGLGGRPGLLGSLDLPVPGGRPLGPGGLTPIFLGRPGPLLADRRAGLSVRAAAGQTGWGLGLGGRPRVFWGWSAGR